MDEYSRLAHNLFSKGKYFDLNEQIPYSYRPPGYPMFLAFLYIIIGYSIKKIYLVQAFMSFLIPVIIYITARRLYSMKSAQFSLLFACFYPNFYLYSAMLYSEILYLFLFSLLIYIFVKIKDDENREELNSNKKFWVFFIWGMIWGVGSLVKPENVIVGLFLCLINLFRSSAKNNKATKVRFVSTILGFMIIVLPWAIRNYEVQGALVPISTNFGMNFLVGANEGATGGYKAIEEIKIHGIKYSDPGEILNEVERDKTALKYAFQFVINEPIKYSTLAVIKLLKWLSFSPSQAHKIITARFVGQTLSVLIAGSGFIVLVLFAISGLIDEKTEKNVIEKYLLITAIIFTCVYLFTFVQNRFRVPTELLLIIFAGKGFERIHEQILPGIKSNDLKAHKLLKKIILIFIAFVFLSSIYPVYTMVQ